MHFFLVVFKVDVLFPSKFSSACFLLSFRWLSTHLYHYCYCFGGFICLSVILLAYITFIWIFRAIWFFLVLFEREIVAVQSFRKNKNTIHAHTLTLYFCSVLNNAHIYTKSYYLRFLASIFFSKKSTEEKKLSTQQKSREKKAHKLKTKTTQRNNKRKTKIKI